MLGVNQYGKHQRIEDEFLFRASKRFGSLRQQGLRILQFPAGSGCEVLDGLRFHVGLRVN